MEEQLVQKYGEVPMTVEDLREKCEKANATYVDAKVKVLLATKAETAASNVRREAEIVLNDTSKAYTKAFNEYVTAASK